MIGESPYIGKGRFRQDILARQRGQGDAEMEDMRRQHDELDRELDEKRKAIEKGKDWWRPVESEMVHGNNYLPIFMYIACFLDSYLSYIYFA